MVQINLQHDRGLQDEKIELERNEITADDYIQKDSQTQHFVLDNSESTLANPSIRPGQPTCNLVLEGTAVGDSILLNATDGSDTDAGDELLLDRTTSGGADAGDKVVQQSDNEGDNVLFEPHHPTPPKQQHKDKYNTQRKEVTTDGQKKNNSE